MDTYRFSLADVDQWRMHLAEHGFVVVSDVLSPAQARDGLSQMWSLMAALSDVREDDPDTWAKSANWPPMLHGGMIQYLGHTPLQWQMRQLCAQVYSAYYHLEPEQLATSFDGLCMMHGARTYRREGDLVSFLHTDQSPRRVGEWSIQGLVTLTDSGPDAGGLVVVPGSHLEHQSFFEGHPSGEQKSDWYKFDDREKLDLAERAIKVEAQAGDFLMWDSRTFHANAVPTHTDAVRACVYVCMLPQARLSGAIRQRRQKAFDERRTSTHHPAEGFKLFPSLPRFVTDRDAFLQRVLALQNPLDLTPLQRALMAGVSQASLV